MKGMQGDLGYRSRSVFESSFQTLQLTVEHHAGSISLANPGFGVGFSHLSLLEAPGGDLLCKAFGCSRTKWSTFFTGGKDLCRTFVRCSDLSLG
jgi:hypothetical protein